jgi:hypothetical protein
MQSAIELKSVFVVQTKQNSRTADGDSIVFEEKQFSFDPRIHVSSVKLFEKPRIHYPKT